MSHFTDRLITVCAIGDEIPAGLEGLYIGLAMAKFVVPAKAKRPGLIGALVIIYVIGPTDCYMRGGHLYPIELRLGILILTIAKKRGRCICRERWWS